MSEHIVNVEDHEHNKMNFKEINHHTLRRNLNVQKETLLEIYRKYERTPTTIEFDMTPVDEVLGNRAFSFDTKGHEYMRICGALPTTAFPLKNQIVMERLMELLTTYHTKKIRRFNKLSGGFEYSYEVPVSGSQVIMQDRMESVNSSWKKTYDDKSHWLKWNDKYYDPAYVYILHDNYLEKYSKFHPEKPVVDNDSYFLSFTFRHNQHPSHTMDTSRTVEFHLKKPTLVTHIATMGGEFNTKLFPERLQRIRKHSRYNYRLWRNARKGFVHIVTDPSTLSWVTFYEVSYQDMQTGKWIEVGKYNGNIDAGNYVVQNIGEIFAKKFRIKSLDHHNEPKMRFMVFGKDVEMKQENDKTNMVDIVTYTIIERAVYPKWIDSFAWTGRSTCSCCRDWGFNTENWFRSNRKKHFKQIINEDIDMMYSDLDEDYYEYYDGSDSDAGVQSAPE